MAEDGELDESEQRARKLGLLIGQLPDNYRECVLLRCARGMSHRQISDITGLPETTVETRIARGRRMLRELANQPAPVDVAATGFAGDEVRSES